MARGSTSTPQKSERLDRAQGCLLGQLIGDALGSLVEFQLPEQIRARYPDGVREMVDGGTWNTIAGQPTDDSELALALARSIVAEGRYDANSAWSAYLRWYESDPFDIGTTVSAALQGNLNYDSQSNGALMRVSPLGIFAAGGDGAHATQMARADARLTHPHEVCQDANVIYVRTIMMAIDEGVPPTTLYSRALDIVSEEGLINSVRETVSTAAMNAPISYVERQGWVLIALQNAFYQLMHANSFERAMVNTVMRGGDTDTNAAICGALVGATHGRSGIPEQWAETVLNCRPTSEDPRVQQPRPEEYWAVDALDLASQLLDLTP